MPAASQRVLLEIRPRPGDTMRVTLEHSFTITGGPRNFPDSTTTMTTAYHIATRDVVERADTKSSFILAIVDSVHMRTTGSLGASQFPGVDRSMEGMRIRLQIARDGSSQITEGMAQLDPDLRAVLSMMPPVLPVAPVSVGESWVRDLPIPADGSPSSASTPGTVKATFRLDSLTANGDLAWISLRGRVQTAPAGSQRDAAGIAQMSGSLSGLLILDRRRGWLSQSRATVDIESQVALSGGSPLLVRVHMTQVMKTAPGRR